MNVHDITQPNSFPGSFLYAKAWERGWILPNDQRICPYIDHAARSHLKHTRYSRFLTHYQRDMSI